MKHSVIANMFYPPRCARCDKIPGRDAPLCLQCERLLLHKGDPKRSCEVCFFPHDKCVCTKRQFIKHYSASFFYENEAISTVFKLKFRSRRDIAKNFAEVMYSSLNERNMPEEADIISFIPMTRFDQFKRGYNQSKLMAEYLSRMCSKPCIPVLYKYGKTKTQHSLSSLERTGNLLGMFEPNPKYLNEIQNKNILLIDDVRTTGSTFNECAKTLLIFGAANVSAASFTVTKNRKKKH